MFIRTQRDFDRYIKNGECDYCYKKLIGPPVVFINGQKVYHSDCAKDLAYLILFQLVGDPPKPPSES
jgi:hypothetical protein